MNFYLRISLLFFSISVLSQSVDLDEVVVSESKIDIPFSKNYRSVEVIDSKSIVESGVNNIVDLLQQVSGVDLRRRGVAGTQADLYIRGGGFDQTLLLIDGMKMDDIQTGHHTLNLLLPIQFIERIEIIKGPASRIFGQNAFNGAINIVTKALPKSDKKLFEVMISNPTFGSFKQFGFLINSRFLLKEKFNAQLTFSRSKSDGYRHNTDYSNDFFFFKSEIKTKKNPINIISGFTEKKFGANGFYASPSAIDQYEETQSSFVGISTVFGSEKLMIIPKLYWRRVQDEYIYIRNNPSVYRNLHITNKIYLDFSFSKLFDSSRLNFGIDLSSSSISSNNLGKHNRFTSSLYADYTFRTRDNKLSFSPGFSVSNFSDMSTHFFPGIDIGFDLSKKINLYANYGKTYRIPTYTDLYYSDRNTIGNPNLNPEHAITNEIGIKYSNENIDISSSYFFRKSSNIIDYVKQSEQDKWEATNIRNLDTNGFDFNFLFKISQNNSLRLGYTYLFDKSYVSEVNYSRYAINSLRHQINTRLALKYSNKITHTLINRFGERSNNVSHIIYDSNLKYQLSNNSYFFINVNNIFNEEYYETNLVPMPGRNFLIGIISYFE
ncbi:MAG: TonB-dependent receptor plug domain-containing protein [Flavobacteriaceae bacterium]